MPKIVCYPRREQLSERDLAKIGMLAGERKLIIAQIPIAKRCDVLRAQRTKFIEQLLDGPAPIPLEMPEAIEGDKSPPGLSVENDARPLNPVGLLAIDEVTDDVESAPRFRAFVAAQPFVFVTSEQGMQRGRRSLENRDALRNVERGVRRRTTAR